MEGPLSRFSQSECELLSAFISRSLAKGWSHQRQTALFVVYLTGEKPATECTQIYHATSESDIPDVPTNGFQNLIEVLDVPYDRHISQLTEEILAVQYECLSSTDSTPPPQRDGDGFHRDWGSHYGYPTTAIDAFIDDSVLRYTSDKSDQKRLYNLANQSDISAKRLARISLIGFLPPNDSAGLRDAVAQAERYETVLHQAARDCQIPCINQLVDSLINQFPLLDSMKVDP